LDCRLILDYRVTLDCRVTLDERMTSDYRMIFVSWANFDITDSVALQGDLGL